MCAKPHLCFLSSLATQRCQLSHKVGEWVALAHTCQVLAGRQLSHSSVAQAQLRQLLHPLQNGGTIVAQREGDVASQVEAAQGGGSCQRGRQAGQILVGQVQLLKACSRWWMSRRAGV